MKKIWFYLLFVSQSILGQNSLKLHLGCYNAGDTIFDEDLKKIMTLDIYDHAANKQIYNIFSWTVKISG